jgi:hypothetical protein
VTTVDPRPLSGRRLPPADAFAARLGTYLMLAALSIALLYAIDPNGDSLGANAVPWLKYLPVELAVLAGGFFLLSRPEWPERPRSLWALAALALFILGGSSMTVLARHASIEDSFLGRGLGIAAVFPAFLLFRCPGQEDLVRRRLLGVVVPVVVIMAVGLLVWRMGFRFVDEPHIYHEEIFLPVCAALGVFALNRGAARWAGGAVLWFVGLLSLKYTGMLAGVVVAVLVAGLVWRRGGLPAATRLRRVLVIEAVLWTAVLAVSALLLFRDSLPSGSPAVRVFTYAERLSRFMEHPILGSGFVGSPMLSLFRKSAPTNLYIPSHSDILDILAFGGVIAFTLFAGPIIVATRRGIRWLPTFVRQRDWLGAFAAGTVPVFTAEMLFNPVWNQPNLAVWFWFAVGFLLARPSAVPQT